MNAQALKHLKKDLEMAALMERVGALKFKPHRLHPYESLIESIIHQQLSGKAAQTIFGRFRNVFPKEAFPKPQQILKASSDILRSAGLSHAKISYVKNIAQHAEQGLIPSLKDCDSMTDEEIVQSLISIKGVGRWTVEMTLIFNLGRPDVFPIHDLGVRKGYQTVYKKRKLPEPAFLSRQGVRWAPHRTTAALYLWRAADLLKQQ